MASYRATAAKVAESKRQHPDQFCPVERCLWRTGGGRCPRHPTPSVSSAHGEWVPAHMKTLGCCTCSETRREVVAEFICTAHGDPRVAGDERGWCGRALCADCHAKTEEPMGPRSGRTDAVTGA